MKFIHYYPIRCIHHGKPIDLFLVKKLDPTEDYPDSKITDVCRNSCVIL